MTKLEVFEVKIAEHFLSKGRNITVNSRVGDFRIEGEIVFSTGERVCWWVVQNGNHLYGSTEDLDKTVKLSSIKDFENLLQSAKKAFVEEYIAEEVIKPQSKRAREQPKLELIHVQKKYQSTWYLVRFDHDTVRALRKCGGYLMGTAEDNPRIHFVDSWLSAYGEQHKVSVPYKGHVHGVTSIRMD